MLRDHGRDDLAQKHGTRETIQDRDGELCLERWGVDGRDSVYDGVDAGVKCGSRTGNHERTGNAKGGSSDGLPSVHHHEGRGDIPHERSALDILHSHLLRCLLLRYVSRMKLLLQLAQGDAGPESRGDIEQRKTQAKPSEWCYRLKNEPVERDERGEEV